MKSILFVTANEMKAAEAEEILGKFGISVERTVLEIDEIQEKETEKVAKAKAVEAYKILKKPLIVEDTGLFIGAMNGYPGVLAKHFVKSIGLQGIVGFVRGKDRSAEAITTVAFCDSEENVKLFSGSVKGKISETVKKGYTFSWDTIFIPDGHDKTYSELGPAEKNKISQRKKALEKFAEWFISYQKS